MKDNKQELIMQLIATLTAMLQDEEKQNKVVSSDTNMTEDRIEFLTIHQCTELVKGLSEHTIRQLVAQEKVKFIRTGQGVRGKILVNKESLLDYLNNNCD